MTWTRVAAYWIGALVAGLLLRASLDDVPEMAAVETTRVPLVEMVPERVDRFRLAAKDLEMEFVRGEDGRWKAVSAEGEEVAHDIVEAVVQTLAGLPVIEAVAEARDAADQFGLRNPALRLRLDAGGTSVANLALGRLNPTRTAVYVRRAGEDRVFLLGLNARYYMDLIVESASRGRDAREVTPTPAAGAPPAVAPVQGFDPTAVPGG